MSFFSNSLFYIVFKNCTRSFEVKLKYIEVNRKMLMEHIFSAYKMKPILNGITSSKKCLFSTAKSYSNHRTFLNCSKKPCFSSSQRAHTTNLAQISAYTTKDHHYTWIWERATAIGLIGLLPASFFNSSIATEGLACLIVSSHLHWGLEAICTDYLRPAVVGKFIPKYISFIVLIPIVLTLYGCVCTMTSSKGISHLLRQLWQLKTTEELDSIDNPKN